MLNYNWTKLTLLLGTLVILSGCFEERENLFEEEKLEWTAPDPATNTLDKTAELDAEEEGTYTATLTISYAGEPLDEEITAAFEVDEGESEAEEGVHFDFATGTEVTIPAQAHESEEIEITVYGDQLENGESASALFTITEESSVEPMENYSDFEFTVEKEEAELEGEFDNDIEGVVELTGFFGNFVVVIDIEGLEDGQFQWFIFDGVCGDFSGFEEDNVTGEIDDYSDIEADDGEADDEAEVDAQINANAEYHVRIFDMDENQIACTNLE